VLIFNVMVRGNLRSKTYRRVYVTTPGGREVIHYKRRAPAKSKCAECETILHGVARGSPAQVKKLPKTARRPERPFAGKLCSKCMRKAILTKSLS